MSILRSAFNLRPLLRTPAVPSLSRGIRNWDVNTPTEGAVGNAIQGDSEPSLDAENQAQESETGNVSAEQEAFVNANKNFMNKDTKEGTEGLNKKTVDLNANRDIGKGNPDDF